MIRRSIMVVCALVAMTGLSSCATFTRNDAVATVNGKELSRTDLGAILKAQIVQANLTGELDGNTAHVTDQAGKIIGIWVVLNAIEQAGAADLSGAKQQAALTQNFKDQFTGAPPVVQRLLVQYAAFGEASTGGSLDREKLLKAIKDADVHVDSRYGYWDSSKASVLPFA